MDDRFAYMLNNLWTRYYDLGRILRFRHVSRGRQTVSFEILTAEQREYAVYLFAPVFDMAQLERTAQVLTRLLEQRFPIHTLVPARNRQWSVGGPQGTHMVVAENPVGQYVLPDQWTVPGLSQLGLRLAWLHKLLLEHVAMPRNPLPASPIAELHAALAAPAAQPTTPLAHLNAGHLAALQDRIKKIGRPTGWCHGDMQPAAILLDADHQIRSVVDWGLLHTGEPLEDIVDAFVHWCVAADGIVQPELGRVLLESYRSLRSFPERPWGEVVARWCGRRVVDAAAGRRPLPRGFANHLADPDALATAMQLCEAK